MKQNTLQSLSHTELWAKAQDYFKSIDDHNRKGVNLIPYSQKGFAKHLGLNYNQWMMFKASNLHDGVDDMSGRLKSIIQTIEVHQLEGAMIGVFKPGILNKWFERQGM